MGRIFWDEKEIFQNEKLEVTDFLLGWTFWSEGKKDFNDFENSIFFWIAKNQWWLHKINRSIEKNNELEKYKINLITKFLWVIVIILFLILVTLVMR